MKGSNPKALMARSNACEHRSIFGAPLYLTVGQSKITFSFPGSVPEDRTDRPTSEPLFKSCVDEGTYFI